MQVPSPYTRIEKYVFISYSQRDSIETFHIINKLIENGYRIWFDEGIDPGMEYVY